MTTSNSLVLYDPATADPEVIGVAGFLAGYSDRTREAYTLDLRQFCSWVATHHLRLIEVRRAHIELYARELEEAGRARATIGRRLSTITSFYRYVEEEGLIDHSPAVHVRRPRLDYESHAGGLDRNELGALLVAAGLSNAQDHALISLLALNGLLHLRGPGGRHREPGDGKRPPHPPGPSQGPQDRDHPPGPEDSPGREPGGCTTMRYDRARQSLDRHATYIVATFVAGASRGDVAAERFSPPPSR